MVESKAIKEWLLQMLETKIDTLASQQHFARRQKSITYKRVLSAVASQMFSFHMAIRPKYAPGSLTHIYPLLTISMPKVSKIAVDLVKEKNLLPCPEKTIFQPINLLAPKDNQARWYIYDKEQMSDLGDEIGEFLTNWVFNFLDDYCSPEGLVRGYEQSDYRLPKSEQQIIQVVASHISLGNVDKAEEVLAARFSRPGIKKRYQSAFDYIARLK